MKVIDGAYMAVKTYSFSTGSEELMDRVINWCARNGYGRSSGIVALLESGLDSNKLKLEKLEMLDSELDKLRDTIDDLGKSLDKRISHVESAMGRSGL